MNVVSAQQKNAAQLAPVMSAVVGHERPAARTFTQSSKLQDVLYEIRGPVHEHAARLEAEGHRILKLNIGNPAPFGFEAPDVIMRDMIQALPYAQGYSRLQGHPARPPGGVHPLRTGRRLSAVRRRRRLSRQRRLRAHHDDAAGAAGQRRPGAHSRTGLSAVDGVRRRWPAARPVHYLCDETQGWMPDIADLESKITDRTKAIVVINPNNPTGAVYTREVLEADRRSRPQAPAAAARRRDLRQDPLRRRQAHRDRVGRPGPADA